MAAACETTEKNVSRDRRDRRGSFVLFSEGVNAEIATVAVDRDLAVEIGAIHPGADGVEAAQDFGGGVAEGVPPPTTDQRNLRAPVLQQFR